MTPGRFAALGAGNQQATKQLSTRRFEQEGTEGTESFHTTLCSLCCLLFISFFLAALEAIASADSDDWLAGWQPQSRKRDIRETPASGGRQPAEEC